MTRAQGRTSQAQGAALERYLIATAHAAGVLLIHIPTPVQILAQAPARAGRPADPRLFLARLEPPRAVDFVGLTREGRPLYLEAKTTSDDASPRRWTLPDRLRLPDAAHPDRGHQGAQLLDAHARGAWAGVYLRWGAVDYLIPADALPLAVASWSRDDVAPHRAPTHGRWWEGI
jgi:hypothetical protein